MLVNRDTLREPSETTDNASQTNTSGDNSEDLFEPHQEETTRPNGPDNSTQQVLPQSINSSVHVSRQRSNDSNNYPPPEHEVRSDNGPDQLSLAL